ncbi:vasoactive intestinal polypeptide receptor 1 isoform X1 [Lates japonicus]|uniref:Vasoactive intestinal polypeptide receptor 1 isoform X1 n=1 Tax=Lates japonicus TaxID=270547 RepID=A0AAD3MIG6_LATJO|nr:vasoactive intestinal polypeptide receptor 1 isoform X1 [Lates japonicus]
MPRRVEPGLSQRLRMRLPCEVQSAVSGCRSTVTQAARAWDCGRRRWRRWTSDVAARNPGWMVLSVQMCDVVNEIELERERCENSTSGNVTSGCQGTWDIIACWPSARVGEVVTITCPTYFSYFSDEQKGNLSKTCTANGWTEMRPIDIAVNCGYNLNSTSDDVGCKAVIVFFQYCIMASFFWLLVEGLYLHALLAVSFFSERKYFWAYILIGWGGPTIFITAWSIAKAYYNDVGCWDIIENTDVFWWIIKTPILASILMNFILFICIIRILRQKINCPDIGRNESNQYSRLAKSTLLLIPLFGINFIVFAFIPEQVKTELRLVFDLILGSFQGFVVAVLYCFLNGEVQGEIKRKWRRWHLQRYMGSDTKYQHPSIGSSNNFSTQITMLTRCSPKTRRGSSSCHDDLSSI